MRFRPCIDLHDGRVKQIVGGTLEVSSDGPVTNFESEQPPEFFADLYFCDGLSGGHVIKLGPGNEDAARAALGAHPGTLQIGGGITAENAAEWLEAGASHVIVTSHVFVDGELSLERLEALVRAVGREKLVLDLSCRRRGDDYLVVCDRWRTFTSLRVDRQTLEELASHCAEFLIHGVDVEGLQSGVEGDLVKLLGECTPVPTTYAGGVRDLADVELVEALGNNRLDVTVGSALDIFGGSGVTYEQMLIFDRAHRA